MHQSPRGLGTLSLLHHSDYYKWATIQISSSELLIHTCFNRITPQAPKQTNNITFVNTKNYHQLAFLLFTPRWTLTSQKTYKLCFISYGTHKYNTVICNKQNNSDKMRRQDEGLLLYIPFGKFPFILLFSFKEILLTTLFPYIY